MITSAKIHNLFDASDQDTTCLLFSPDKTRHVQSVIVMVHVIVVIQFYLKPLKYVLSFSFFFVMNCRTLIKIKHDQC